ncbi:MAG: carbamoyltransferase HypF [Pseudomonadota bacterium]
MATVYNPTNDVRRERRCLRIRGAVQGVGFRPFLWALAQEFDLAGWVLNDAEGVLAEIEGPRALLDQFIDDVEKKAPPLSRVDAVEYDQRPLVGGDGFEIRESLGGDAVKTSITPDMATCPDCLEDIFDPENHRYLYPFTNCTHCGPRYTIARSLPYDRAKTSMAPFAMCPTCQTEYENPADRRFHAQPNACSDCGPALSHSPADIITRLGAGEIVAIKGLGGFHLAVDARNERAVARLRQRKGRDGKPFAVMVAGIASARKLADLSPDEATLLTDRTRPIVIAKAIEGTGIAPSVSKGLPSLGLMLPYTPIHYLLFHLAAGAPNGTSWLEVPQDLALVMTSANPGGEPLVTGNTEACKKLHMIADTIVVHDRDILVRADDSVVRMVGGAPAYLRRARGLTPEPILLSHDVPPTLAVGGHLKSAICVTRGREAFSSQHIGDLENAATINALHETVTHLLDILDVTPERVACDLHPDFASTRFAEKTGLPLVRVQHHHAHIAAVAAEHGIEGPAIGLALDGYGLGADGRQSWGGECLKVDGSHFSRIGYLKPIAQPGGDRAARAPWRMGAAALHSIGRGNEIETRYKNQDGVALLKTMLERGVNAPLTSSAGRYFDAACGILGILDEASFEAEAPMRLEALATAPRVLDGGWHMNDEGALDLHHLWETLLDCTPSEGANLFHGTLAAALAELVEFQLRLTRLPRTILAGGGCFQNNVLTTCLMRELHARDIELRLPRKAPANDGGLSLGQAWVAIHAADTELER